MDGHHSVQNLNFSNLYKVSSLRKPYVQEKSYLNLLETNENYKYRKKLTDLIDQRKLNICEWTVPLKKV